MIYVELTKTTWLPGASGVRGPRRPGDVIRCNEQVGAMLIRFGRGREVPPGNLEHYFGGFSLFSKLHNSAVKLDGKTFHGTDFAIRVTGSEALATVKYEAVE